MKDVIKIVYVDFVVCDCIFMQSINGMLNVYFIFCQGNFIIKYYVGDVMYIVDGIIDKNKDFFFKGFLNMF